MNKELKIVYTIFLVCGILSLAWGIIFCPNFIVTFGDLRDIYSALGVYQSYGLFDHSGWNIDNVHIKFIIGGIVGIIIAFLIKGFAKNK